MICVIKVRTPPLRRCAPGFRRGEAEEIFSVESLCLMSGLSEHSDTCRDMGR